MLPRTFPDKSQVPQDAFALYCENPDGSFTLHAEILADRESIRTEIQTLRQANIELAKDLEALHHEKQKIQTALAQFDGHAPEELRAEQQRLQAAADARDPAAAAERRAAALEAAHAQRMREHEARGAEQQKRLDELNARINEVAVTSAILKVADKYGVRQEGLEDLLNRALVPKRGRVHLQEKDGVLTAIKDGEPLLNDAGEPEGVAAFFSDAIRSAPHLFHENRGSGAVAGNGSGSSAAALAGPNPYERGPGFNLTAQAKLEKRDPARARLLQQMAR